MRADAECVRAPSCASRLDNEQLIFDCLGDLDVRATLTGDLMEPQIRLIHWYDVEHRRVACGAVGQSNSTKHARSVTCTTCAALATAWLGGAVVTPYPLPSYLQ